MATTDNSTWIRKYLQDRGFADKDIGYDNKTGTVTYLGKDFIKADSVVNGKSYASTDSLNSALQNYNIAQNQSSLNDLIKQYSSGVQGSTYQPFQATVQAPVRQQFTYNPDSDPQYQAALRRAQENAAQAGRQTQEELNTRGILNSTVTSDRLGQIQQSEVGKVTDNVLPQLMQQAYQRYSDDYNSQYQNYLNQYNQQYQNYTDQYNQGQDKYKNLQSLIPLISGVNQQAIDNQYRDNTFNWQKETDTRNFDYGVSRDKVADAQFEKEFQERVKQDGVQNALAWAQQKISQQNANTSSASLAWSKDPNNPDNIYKGKQIDLLGQSEYKGLTANQVLDNIRSAYTEPVMDTYGTTKIGEKITSDPAKREQMFLNVIDAGLGTDAETRQVLTMLGLTKDEIEKFTKKYGG